MKPLNCTAFVCVLIKQYSSASGYKASRLQGYSAAVMDGLSRLVFFLFLPLDTQQYFAAGAASFEYSPMRSSNL